MNVVIIEDEKIVANRLEQLLLGIDDSIRILAKIRTVREAAEWLKINHPDLIFLDIHLADGLSFKLFDLLEVKTPVIFTTAYDQYAIKAFKVNSIDYLLKPIDVEALKQSIDKFKNLAGTKHFNTNDIQSLVEALKTKRGYKKRFTISTGTKIKVINTNNMAYFYVLEKSVFIRTIENKNIAIDYSLDKLENLLDPELFFRVNRKCLIHIDSIKTIYTLSKSRIKIELDPPANDDVIISF